MNAFSSNYQPEKEEFLHLSIFKEHQLLACWNIADWRYRFVRMYSRNDRVPSCITVRLIGWKENSHTRGTEANYLDTMIKNDRKKLILPTLPAFTQYVAEVGEGEGDSFFPILQSSKLQVEFHSELSPLLPAKDESWKRCSLNSMKWYSQFSTYTYYE